MLQTSHKEFPDKLPVATELILKHSYAVSCLSFQAWRLREWIAFLLKSTL